MRGCEKTICHFLGKARGSLQERWGRQVCTSYLQYKILIAHKQEYLARGQGPRTQVQVFSKNKKNEKGLSGDLQKKGLQKTFSSDLQNFNNSKNSAVLKPKTGQISRTWGFEAKAKDLRLRGQGLQNVFSRPKTFLRTPSLVRIVSDRP